MCVFLFGFFFGCKNREVKPLLRVAERIVAQEPDSVFHLLSQLDFSSLESPQDRADFALLYTESLDNHHIDLGSDSLLRFAWNYYTRRENHRKAAKCNFYMGLVAYNRDSLVAAGEYFAEAAHRAERGREEALCGRIYHKWGNLYLRLGHFAEARSCYRKALTVFRRIKNESDENYTWGEIGRSFFYENLQDSALCYYRRAKEIAVRRKDWSYCRYLNADLITLYLNKGHLDTARLLLHERNPGEEFSSPLDFLRDSLDVKRKITFYPYTNSLVDSSWNISAHIVIRPLEKKENGNRCYSLKYNNLSDTSVLIEKDFLFQRKENDRSQQLVGQKYRNEQLKSRNYELELKNYRKSVTVLILFLVVIILIFLGWVIGLYHRKIVKEKNHTIDEYLALIEALKEEQEFSKNSLLGKLNEQNEKERLLKNALTKRLLIIKQLTDLSFKWGNNEKLKDIFCKKVSELMNVDQLTQEMLDDLPEITNLNYDGIVDYLQANFDMSKDELILCCFIIAGFTPQEMSILYNVQVHNIYVRCSRLGKKMGLPIPLTAFVRETVEKRKSGCI